MFKGVLFCDVNPPLPREPLRIDLNYPCFDLRPTRCAFPWQQVEAGGDIDVAAIDQAVSEMSVTEDPPAQGASGDGKTDSKSVSGVCTEVHHRPDPSRSMATRAISSKAIYLGVCEHRSPVGTITILRSCVDICVHSVQFFLFRGRARSQPLACVGAA